MIFYNYEEYIYKLLPIFHELKKEIKIVIPDARIEHIGSSSIEGSISKGDLDIYVGVDKKAFNLSLNKIKTMNFYEKEGTLRTDDLCMLVSDRYEEDVAIQLVVNNSLFEDFIRFRDILSKNKNLIKEYNALKVSSVGIEPNEYRRKKSVFVEDVLSREEL